MKELKVVDVNKRRNIDITRIDISKVDSRGYYSDINHNIMIRLNDQEIDGLRLLHHNPYIARNRLVGSKDVRVNCYSESAIRKKRKIVKKNNNKRIKKRTKSKSRAFIIKLVLSSVIASSLFFGVDIDDKPVQDAAVSSNDDEFVSFDTFKYFSTKDDEKIEEEKEEETGITPEMIKKYTDIYQVNYDIVSDIISKLTNNYTSSDYLNNCNINGIVCKSEQIHPKSYEELLLYVVRNIQQTPNKFGLESSQIDISNGYQSSDDYFNTIYYYSNMFHLDEALVAAIINSECGFDSPLFNYDNNPAGLRLSKDEWWSFPTKEAGIIETCLEIRKYYKKVKDKDYDPNNCDFYPVNENIIRQIKEQHAPSSDNNIYWLGNVIESYNEYDQNRDSYFKTEEKTHRL